MARRSRDARSREEPTELGPVAVVRGPWVVVAVLAVATALAALIWTPLDGLLVGLVAAGLLGLLVFLTVASNRERRREAAARSHFERHGRWPGER